MRSYETCDIAFKLDASNRATTFGSNWGAIYLVYHDLSTVRLYGPQPVPDGWKLDSGDATAIPRKFEWEISSGKATVSVPHSLPVVGCIVVGFAPWIRRRFNLRTLLIAIAFISFLLGVVIWSLRLE